MPFRHLTSVDWNILVRWDRLHHRCENHGVDILWSGSRNSRAVHGITFGYDLPAQCAYSGFPCDTVPPDLLAIVARGRVAPCDGGNCPPLPLQYLDRAPFVRFVATVCRSGSMLWRCGGTIRAEKRHGVEPCAVDFDGILHEVFLKSRHRQAFSNGPVRYRAQYPASSHRTALRFACIAKRDGGSSDGVSCVKCYVDTLAASAR